MFSGEHFVCNGCSAKAEVKPRDWFVVVLRTKKPVAVQVRTHFCSDLCFDRYIRNGLPMGTIGEVVNREPSEVSS